MFTSVVDAMGRKKAPLGTKKLVEASEHLLAGSRLLFAFSPGLTVKVPDAARRAGGEGVVVVAVLPDGVVIAGPSTRVRLSTEQITAVARIGGRGVAITAADGTVYSLGDVKRDGLDRAYALLVEMLPADRFATAQESEEAAATLEEGEAEVAGADVNDSAQARIAHQPETDAVQASLSPTHQESLQGPFATVAEAVVASVGQVRSMHVREVERAQSQLAAGEQVLFAETGQVSVGEPSGGRVGDTERAPSVSSERSSSRALV